MNYIYAIKNEYRDDEGMAKAGFSKYESDDGDVFYAIGIRMPLGNPVTANLKKALERLYRQSSGPDREEMRQLGFDEDGSLIMDDETVKALTECQLCVSAQGEGAWMVFVNSPDHIEYYNSKVVDACAFADIQKLRKKRITRKTPVPKGQITAVCEDNDETKAVNKA